MPDRPILTMIAGPNGSGKSTLTDQMMRAGVDLGTYINADLIDRTLPGPSGEERSKRAQDLAAQERESCLETRRSFTFETVMSHASKIELLGRAREAGYAIVTYFVALEEPRLNIERVRQRVELGGHPVPEDRIIARYHRCLSLLPRAIASSDRTMLFDNSYRRHARGKVILTPILDIRRTAGEPNDRFDYRTSDGAPLSFMDIAGMPRWCQHILPVDLVDRRKRFDSSRVKRSIIKL